MKRYPMYRRTRNHAQRSKTSGGSRIAICLIICALILVCKHYYPQSISALQSLILGDENGRINQAVQAMSDAFERGRGVSEAVEVFWQGMRNGSTS